MIAAGARLRAACAQDNRSPNLRWAQSLKATPNWPALPQRAVEAAVPTAGGTAPAGLDAGRALTPAMNTLVAYGRD